MKSRNVRGRWLAVGMLLLAGGLTAHPVHAATAHRAAGAAAVSATFPPISRWLTVFEEEFNGTFNGQPIVDTKNLKGAAMPDGLDDRVWMRTNWGDPEAISVESSAVGGDPGQPADGYLTLRAYTENGRTYNPDWLITGKNDGSRPPFESTYGYIEGRYKLAQPNGTNQAFFMYSSDLHWRYGQPLRDPAAAGAEVDIQEEWRNSGQQVHHNVHWDGYDNTHRHEGTEGISCPGSVCEGNFHTYGVLWDPTGYRFFIDGQETWFMPRGVSHHPLHLMIGAARNESNVLGPKGDPRNSVMLIDYVKIWQPAVSDIANQTLRRNVPAAVPFTVSHVASADPKLPGPRLSSVDAISSNQNVVRNADLKVYGTGADRTVGIMSRNSGGQLGTTTITVRAKNATGTVIGSDTFTVTVTDPAVSVPTLVSGALPEIATLASRPAAIEFQTNAAEGTAPTVTARSSNQYLLPDNNFGLSGDGRVRSLALTPLPTRTGTADVTVTVRDPADGSVSSDTFRVTVTHGELVNAGFESGLAPWNLVGGSTPVVSAAAKHSGTNGLHIDIAAVKQRISVEPNTTYAVGAWGRTSAPGGFFEIGVLDTNTYPDWDGNGDPDDQDGPQTKSVRFDSTTWSKKEVVFKTGPHAKVIEIFASNAFLSDKPFDVDDFYLVDAPNLSQIPDQSIGHSTCVVPTVYAGRIGNPSDAWTLQATVTSGDTSLITGASVVNPGGSNPHKRGVRITPTTDQTRSGQATITLTATDVNGRTSTDSFTVWVNAGSFRNGSFEHSVEHGAFQNGAQEGNPNGDFTYPGCAMIPGAWNNFFAPNAHNRDVVQTYDWAYGAKNRGLNVFQVAPSGGTPYGGWVFQDVTGLQPNTEYVLQGWLGLDTWPDPNQVLPDGAAMSVEGSDITLISPTSGKVNQFKHGWSQRFTIRFRTGASGTAKVNLAGPNVARHYAMFHDITLLKA